MANPWFRCYSEIVNDAKVQMLPEAMRWRWIAIMSLRCEETLETLQERQIAFRLRITPAELAETKAAFVENGFIDDDWHVVNWNRRQFISDSSTERVRRHRQAMKQSETLHETERNVTVTPPEQNRTDSDKNQSRSEQTLSASPSEKSVGVSKPKKSPDGRHMPFKNAFEKYFAFKNKGAAAGWDDKEAANLSRFLRKQPTVTLEQWQDLLRNRAASPVAHGDDLSAWIGRAMNWSSGPTDGFGKPISTGGITNGKHAPTAKETYVVSAIQASLDRRRAARESSRGEDGAGSVIEAGEPRALTAGDRQASGSLFGTSAADRLGQI